MYAASQGGLALWSDSPSISWATFIKSGLEMGRDPGLRSQLSEFVRSSGDIRFYRHWHGPLYYYGLGVLKSWNLSEEQVRAAASWIPAFGIVAVYAATLWLFPGTMLPAFLAAALYGWGHSVVYPTEIAPHQLFVLTSLVPLFFLAKLMFSGEHRWWMWAAASLSLSFVTMELAFISIGVMMLLGWMHRRQWQLGWTRLRQSIGAFLIPTFLLWPAGLGMLSIVCSYIFMAYLAVFRRGAWGDVTFSGAWAVKLADAPLEWLLVAASVFLWSRNRRSTEFRAAAPFFLFGLLMQGVTLKVYATAPRYTLPSLAPLLVAAGVIFGLALQRHRQFGAALAAIIALGVGAETWLYVRNHVPQPDDRSVRMLQALRSQSITGTILVPQEDIPVLHYYFPGRQLKAYRNAEEKSAGLATAGLQAVVVDDPVSPVQFLP